MTKTIDTLIEDIYGLFNSEFTISEKDSTMFGERLAKHLVSRLGERREGNHLRLSNIGTPCTRKLWYTINASNQAEPLPPAARLKFLLGDITEELLLFLAAQAGHKVEGEQDELDIAGVKGHRDAVIDGVLVDVKSASSRSWDKFASGKLADDDPFGYIDQLGSYSFASQKDHRVSEKDYAAFLVMDKQLGKICLDKHPTSDVPYDQVVQEKKELVAQPEPPERPYQPVPDGKSGNLKLGTVCSYCPFKYPCWSDANNGKGLRTFLYSSGPRYLTEVKREPDVIEIDIDNNLIPREE